MKDDENANKFVAVIPRCPLSLIPLSASEKGENPLISRKGEVLGSRNDFKMNTSNVHVSGTMLLDMAHIALLESSETATNAAQPSAKAVNLDNENINTDKNFENGDPIANMSVDDNDIDMCEPADDVIMPCEEGTIQVGKDAMTAKTSGKRTKVKVKAVVDHWKALLDPHDPGCTAEKPLKKGRTVRIPLSLQEEQTTRKRKRTKQADKKSLPPLSEIVFKLFYSTESRLPPASQKATLFKEFERSYWKEFKRRQMWLRKARKDMVMSEEVDDDQEDEDDHYHADDDDEEDDNPPNFPEIDKELFESLAEQSQIYSQRAGNLSKNTSDGQIISTYEDLVRQYVESYMASAQEYAQITELSRRVSEWEDKITPKLREEETHDPFDIHKYGSTILDNLSFTSDGTVKRIKFRKIVAGKAAFETCRLFLATLQLANSYNIQIETPGILEVGQDEMEVVLLSTRRHFEELAEYQAPSVAVA